jgi:hypothetical protein
MYKSAAKCNETIGKWCKNKHGASKIIDTFETYQVPSKLSPFGANKIGKTWNRKPTLLKKEPIRSRGLPPL